MKMCLSTNPVVLLTTLLVAAVFSQGIASKTSEQSSSKAQQVQENAGGESRQLAQSQLNTLKHPTESSSSSSDANFAPSPWPSYPEEMEFDISDELADNDSEFGDLSEDDKQFELRSADKRYAPRFIGKRYGPRFVGKRYAPRFIGKRYAPRFIGKRQPRFVGKRYAPRFIGKRYAPRFVGKKRDAEELNEDMNDSHIIKKRAVWFSLPDLDIDSDKIVRRSSRYVDTNAFNEGLFDEFGYERLSKRAPPRFVGKRGAPRFIGKRGPPRFVGKRNAPRFIGKRNNDVDEYDILRWGLQNSKRQAPRFIGKRSGEWDQLLKDFARNEAIQTYRSGDKRWSTPVTPGFIGKRMLNDIDDFKR